MALGKGFEIIYFLLGGSGLETYYRLNFFSKINLHIFNPRPPRKVISS